VVGDAFIKENFSVPMLADQINPMTGQLEKVPRLDRNGELEMRVDEQMVVRTFNEVLNDTGIGKYDIAVGEVVSSETLKYANYLVLLELASKGIPIPPDVLIDESMISGSSKQKIKRHIERQLQAQSQVRPGTEESADTLKDADRVARRAAG
jgi:hypothetical protein